MDLLCITGTRADYGIYRPLLFELEKSPLFKLKLVVTGMHLLSEYGRTIEDIKQDPFFIEATPSILMKGDSTFAMSQSIGLAIMYFSDILQSSRPHSILILGDRGEMLAAAIAAHYQNIGIIHLCGGELSGSADDAVRHAISKLAHIHFVTSLAAKDNLLSQGEEQWRIHPVGTLRKHDIERIKNLDTAIQKKLAEKYHLQSHRKKILFVFHPDSKENYSFAQQIDWVLAALMNYIQHQIIIIGTNSDAGGDLFREKLLKFSNQHPLTVHYYSSIHSDDYLFLLSQVDLLIGNSSSGIVESPFFQLPVINIGNRQKNRVQGDNVLSIDFNQEEVEKVLFQELTSSRKSFSKNPYDVNKSPAHEIKRIMGHSLLHPEFLVKKINVRRNSP
ncbi:MAG TPA: UDP-N-acetylglucosamine 2-epimerase (hydrolyzing) [Paenibacillaceae bacterium]|nr:UDP-N-acetylglucosamine 2-epimerase (hydrolyzing) [Paenibacillaceae bacterium]